MTANRSPELGESFKTVFKEELKCLRHRWDSAYSAKEGEEKHQGRKAEVETPTTENNLVGLAFSGGGIRSATINTGIAQALHRRGVFDHVDYLSTVSGGGYLGSSISTAMRELPAEGGNAPEGKGRFPFKYKEPQPPAKDAAAGEPPEVETGFLTWVRNNSNYMATGGFLDWPRIFGVVLRGMLANFLVLVPILLAVALMLVWWHGGMLANWEAADQGLADARKVAATDAADAQLTERLASGGDAAAWEKATTAKRAADEAATKVKELEAQAPSVSTFFMISIAIAGVFLLLVLIFPAFIRVYKAYRHGDVQETGEEESSVGRSICGKTFSSIEVPQ